MSKIFGASPCVIGMLHVPALPGTPTNRISLKEIDAQVLAEAREYARLGIDALLIENMHDRPYLRGGVGPEIVAAMTRLACAVRREVALPCGVQILAAANAEALAVALAADLEFLRVEGFVFSHVADEGWIDGCAGELLRLRKHWGAEHIQIFADIKKKHASHAVTGDVSLEETARAAEFFLADGLIVTASSTGSATDSADVEAALRGSQLPLLIGSGVTPENACHYQPLAAGFIVGSSFKERRDWRGPLDPARVEALLRAMGR